MQWLKRMTAGNLSLNKLLFRICNYEKCKRKIILHDLYRKFEYLKAFRAFKRWLKWNFILDGENDLALAKAKVELHFSVELKLSKVTLEGKKAKRSFKRCNVNLQ